MLKLRVMVMLIFIGAYSFALKAQTTPLVITEVFSTEKVEFKISNTGAVPISISYIVIQDNVLMREQGQSSILPGEVVTISIQSDTPQSHTFTLEYDILE